MLFMSSIGMAQIIVFIFLLSIVLYKSKNVKELILLKSNYRNNFLLKRAMNVDLIKLGMLLDLPKVLMLLNENFDLFNAREMENLSF